MSAYMLIVKCVGQICFRRLKNIIITQGAINYARAQTHRTHTKKVCKIYIKKNHYLIYIYLIDDKIR